jgi:diadenylate cyclase
MELFKIGFLTVKLIDVVDILIVSYIFFRLYKLMKGTIAFQIFFALVLIIGFSLIAQVLNLQALGWFLSRITEIWVIAFIILFQPELRRLLSIIGKTRLAKLFFKLDASEDIDEVSDACREISRNGWGALIVIVRSTGLQNISENGELIQARINKELLISIFYPRSPLHDGAVIINNNKIEAARCTLPLSETSVVNFKKLGTRHRAGLGITEQSDAISIIVSEETSDISIAEDGKLIKCKDYLDLKQKLKEAMNDSKVTKSFKTILARSKSE